MPAFDFHCTACNTIFEETLPFGAKDMPACPSCRSAKTEKRISMPSVVFKGSGFYKTDSKSTTVPPVKTDKKEEGAPAVPEKKPDPSAVTQVKEDTKPASADSVKKPATP